MKKITVILPVHKLENEYNDMLIKAVESVKMFIMMLNY